MTISAQKKFFSHEDRRLPARLIAFIGGEHSDYPLEHRLFNILALFNGLGNILGIFFMWHLPQAQTIIWLHAITGIAFLSMFVWVRAGKCGHEKLYWPFVGLMCVFLFMNALENGASTGGAHYYFILAGVIAVILSRKGRYALISIVLLSMAAASVMLIERFYPEMVLMHQDASIRWYDVFGNYLFVLLVTALVVLIMSYTLEYERSLSDRLLHNILPARVAEELKRKGHVTPRHHDQASVLFLDISGFTAMAAERSPEELIRELDTLFSEFDQICAANGVSRIKTVGDAYMAATGVPEEDPQHLTRLLEAAIGIRDFTRRYNHQKEDQNTPRMNIRLGLHTGPLISGIVGKDKFAYDIWGDTVNVASRMESNGITGSINVSRDVYELAKHAYAFEYRGEIEAKNRGFLEMYLLT